ncbi:MAG: ArgE/DapE family deacylase [Nocardioidaceae bacterium]
MGSVPERSAVERLILEAVDDDETLRDLAALMAIPSVDGEPAEARAQHWGAERLKSLELEVDHWEIDVDAQRADPDFPGMEVNREYAYGCVGVLGDPASTPALALYGHTDVVPPGDLDLWPNRDPYTMRIVDDVAFGRGACDMKGGVAAALGAVAAVRRSGVTLSRPLAVHLVSAEEDGGLGAFATLRRGHTAQTCIITEPTARTIVPANAGALTFRLEIGGLATHGSTRSRGVSAVEKFELIHRGLRDLETERNRQVHPLFAHLDPAWPLSVGIVSAGHWASTVPDLLVAEGRYGVRSDETMAQAQAAFEQRLAEICVADPWLRDHPVVVSWPGGMFAPGALPEGHRLLDDVRRAAAEVGGSEPGSYGGPYGSDLRHYAAAGVPTLQYGPGDVRFAHATDEHVEIDDLRHCARVYALLIARLCAADGHR